MSHAPPANRRPRICRAAGRSLEWAQPGSNDGAGIHNGSHQRTAVIIWLLNEGITAMKEKPKDLRRCFKCGRDLGPQLEWKKMDTEAGPICYVCFNDAASESRKAPNSGA